MHYTLFGHNLAVFLRAVSLSRIVEQIEKPERKVFVYALLSLSTVIQSAVNLR